MALPITFPVAPVSPVAGLSETVAPAAPASTPGVNTDFGNLLTQQVDQLQGMHTGVDALGVQAATGDLKDVHDFMIASTEAALATDMVVTVRNKAVEAFNEIMRMQV